MEGLKRLITYRKKKNIIIATVFLAVLIIVILFLLLSSNKNPENTLKIMDDQVDLQVMNVHYTEVTEEGIKWDIKADNAQYRKKENLALFKNPIIKLLMPNGRTFIMTGKEGILHQDTKNIEMTGNINLVSNSGDEFKTDRLSYSAIEKRCHTDSPVTLKNSRIRIEAKGLSLSLKDEHLSLLSDVKAIVH